MLVETSGRVFGDLCRETPRRRLSGRGKITIFVIGSREDRHDDNDSRLYTDAGRECAPLAAGGVCLHPDGHFGGGGADQLVDADLARWSYEHNRK